MGHNHNQDENTHKNIVTVLVLNGFFVIIELIGGIMTNSIAILSDALHDFGDCVSLVLVLAFQKKSKKKRDKRYSYGYRRFSLLGAVFLSGIISLSSIFILIEAIKRIFDAQEVDADGMLWLAIFGVIINSAAALRLKKGSSITEKAVFIHIMEDVLGWVAVLIISIVMQFYNLPILDPILSISISIWVMVNVYKNLKETFKILLQGIPDNIDIDELQKKTTNLPSVISIHDMHIWSLDGQYHVGSLHVVSKTQDQESLKEQIRLLALDYDIKHITIEIDNENEICDYNKNHKSNSIK